MPSQSPSALTVSWTMEPFTARRWHAWKSPPRPTPEERALEANLGWPETTIAILNQAFAQKLDRELGWEADVEPGVDPKPFTFAAKVFKRGVAFRPASAEEKRGKYDISFQALKQWQASPTSFLVLDARVAKHWRKHFAASPLQTVFDMDERTKTLTSVAALRAQWQAAGKPAHWVIVGGGVLADTASFAAALEGCTFTLVPTTLLAMIDACVGGKTGVNHPSYGKNQIGLFAFPDAVQIFPEFLTSLPQRELRAGWAEALKHAFLSGDESLLALFQNPIAATIPSTSLLTRLVSIKADVVAKDPTEQGVRATLNLGHTLAHALETLALENTDTTAQLLHGEAVALGLLFCLMLSAQTGSLTDEARLLSLMQTSCVLPSRAALTAALGMPLEDPSLFSRLFRHFAQDKKAGTEGSRWILLDAPGKVRRRTGSYLCDVEKSDLQNTWLRFISFYFPNP